MGQRYVQTSKIMPAGIVAALRYIYLKVCNLLLVINFGVSMLLSPFCFVSFSHNFSIFLFGMLYNIGSLILFNIMKRYDPFYDTVLLQCGPYPYCIRYFTIIGKNTCFCCIQRFWAFCSLSLFLPHKYSVSGPLVVLV